MRALVYTRISDDRAGGRSVAEQEADALEECRRRDWHVVAVETDSTGASRHSKGQRAGWDRARRRIEAGEVDVLVTWEASRATRDLGAYADLRALCVKHGVGWCYSGQLFDLGDDSDRFRTGLDALLGEQEADRTSKRVRRAMRSSAQAGRPPGRRLYGYQRVYDPSTGLLDGQVEHPTEAGVVRSIFADYLAGVGIRTIAGRLRAEGVTTGTGADWNDIQVRRVLTNPAYAARRVHRGEIIGPASWPPLVDPDRFDRVQARFEEKRATRTRQVATARLLTGVGRCGVCGGKVAALHDRRGRHFYSCRTKFCTARDLAKLDRFVGDVIVARLSQPDVAAHLSDERLDPAVAEARATATTLRSRLDDAVAEFTAGRLTARTLAAVEADLQSQIDAADRAQRAALVPVELNLPDTADGLDTWWEALTGEQRREVVGGLLAAVVIKPTVRGTRGFDPDAVDIVWR